MNPELSDESLIELLTRSLNASGPADAVGRVVSFDAEERVVTVAGENYQLEKSQGVWVLGSGKASASMACGLEKVMGEEIRDGIVIAPPGVPDIPRRVQVFEGSHPQPDSNNLASTLELIDLAESIPPGDLVFFMISGGTSALLCKPAGELEIDDVGTLHHLLLQSGSNIYEMNSVRTACSSVKGGQLLRHLDQTRLVDLIISDVPGDDFRTIGSGPTTPGPIDVDEARRILKRYNLWDKVPKRIREFIEQQAQYDGRRDIAPHPGEHRQHLIASASMLAETVAGELREAGYKVWIDEEAYDLPIEKLEKKILGVLDTDNTHDARIDPDAESSADVEPNPDVEINPDANVSAGSCYIFYGESSVDVQGDGKGGRNQEIALRIARHLENRPGVLFASLGTDGVDGPTDAAGAIVTADTLEKARSAGVDPEDYLKNNDSWNFFDKVGGHIKTGPTGNNLMDIQLLMS